MSLRAQLKAQSTGSVNVENIQQRVGFLLHKRLKTENNKTMLRDKIEDYPNMHLISEKNDDNA
jgi:hypothetical protein